MKKTYLQPEVSVTEVRIQNSILDGSLKMSSEVTTTGADGGWAKEETGWDIWGNADTEMEVGE